jgi:thiamine-monophosphate kinase
MFDNSDRTELSQLGEFGLIQHLTQHFENQQKSTLLGVGDDAALIKMGSKIAVWSTDIMLEGVHFDLSYTPLKHLGFKAIATNVSDVCAMNGKATQVLVSVALSNRFSLEAIEELYLGMKIACDKYQVDLVGGDTSTSRSGLVINVTVLGEVDSKKITKRSGAKPGDLLVVSGDLGGAYMGLQILEREKKVFIDHPSMQPDLEPYDYIVGRQLKPEARVDIIETLNELGIVPTSMMDISDGVASEVFHLGKASKVGFDVYENKLPIDSQTMETAMTFNLNPSIVALNGGEDYELLMTIDQKHYDQLKNHMDFTIIGHATAMEGKHRLHTNAGNVFDIKAQGWQHFKQEEK